MKQKYFIGLTFHDDQNCRKVSEFRRRFDAKFTGQLPLHMTLFAPFYLCQTQIKDLAVDLIDQLDVHFYLDENLAVTYTGIDALRVKKANILHLKPIFDDNFSYCIDDLYGLVQTYLEREDKIKTKNKTFLTMARTYDDIQTFNVIEKLELEFNFPLYLKVASISLFEKKFGQWIEVKQLKTFTKDMDEVFLQSQLAYL